MAKINPWDWHYFQERLDADGKIGLEFLRRELGNGFFDTCGSNHPVYLKLMSLGGEPQNSEFLKWIDVLKQLKSSDSNYDHLLKKLRSRKYAWTEAIPFIEISARHLQHGFNLYFPEEKQDKKNHDLELTYLETGEKIYVEVSKIGPGGEQERKEQLYYYLLDICFHHQYSLPVAGKLFKLLPEGQWPELAEKIKRLKQIAVEQRTVASYRDEYFAIAFAHSDCISQLDEWCNENGLPRRFDGFNVEFDYTRRMIKNSRLAKEAKQIPPDRPGLIYCPVHILYMKTMNVPETVAAFAEELKKYPHIFGLVFYAEIMPPMEDPFLVDTPFFCYAMHKNDAHIARYTLMIKNPFFSVSLSTAAKNALVKAAV